MTLSKQAFAKVNLYLHITNKRPDGYHELDSLIVFAQTGDKLFFTPAQDIRLEIRGPMAERIDGDPKDNLVLQAAYGLQKLCGIDKGAHIVLEKHLPVAAGIGGGSGDAAAALKGLCELWGVFPDPEGLHDLALSLGADVPICMKSHAAHVGGIGERITGLAPLPDCWMVLVNPMVAVPTPTVFKTRKGPFSQKQPMMGEYTFDLLIDELSSRHNDLMAPAIAIAPVISEILQEIESQPGCALARMSGSGATCFGLFQQKHEALDAVQSLTRARPEAWVSSGKII